MRIAGEGDVWNVLAPELPSLKCVHEVSIARQRRELLAMTAGVLVSSGALHALGDEDDLPQDEQEQGQNRQQHAIPFLASARSRVGDIQLVFADLQPELIAGSTTTTPASLAAAAAVLAKAGRILSLPMTFCVVPVRGQSAQLIPELVEYSTPANTYVRTITSPFLEPRIVQKLHANNRSTLVVAGFSAEVAVLQTALDGIAEGYSIVVPVDAVGSRSSRTESTSLRQIELAGGVVTSVLSLLTRLAPDISKEPGIEVFKALGALRAS